MNIRKFTEQEQAEFKIKHDLAQPKSWAVMDGSMVYSWYDTEAEAQVGLKEANVEESVYEDFQDWLDEKAEEYGLTSDQIKSMVK